MGEEEEEKKFLRADVRTHQSKVVQEVLADLRMQFNRYKYKRNTQIEFKSMYKYNTASSVL